MAMVRCGLAAGIDRAKLRPLVLRHSATSHLLAAGVDIDRVQRFMRHGSRETTRKYLQGVPESLESLPKVLDDR